MTDGQNVPATRADIALLMGEFGKMYVAQERWKGDLEGKMELWKTELKEHFDLVVENIRHDFAFANRKEIDVLKDGHKGHEKRILTLERTPGIAAG